MPAYSDYRFDVVTGAYLPVEITDEQHTAYSMIEINRYGFITDEIPYFESPSSVTLIRQSDSQVFTEVPISQAPGALEFSIDYQNRANNYGTGRVILDAAYDGIIFEISYKGLGSTLKVRTVRETVTTVPNLLSLDGGAYIDQEEVLSQGADRPDLTTIQNEIDAIRDTDFSKREWELDGATLIDDTANGGSLTTLDIGLGYAGASVVYRPAGNILPLDPNRTYKKRVNYGDIYYAKFSVRCPSNPGGAVNLVFSYYDGDNNLLDELIRPIVTSDAGDHLPSTYCDVCIPMPVLVNENWGVEGIENVKYMDIEIRTEELADNVYIKSFELSKVNIFTKQGVYHYLEMAGSTSHYGISSESNGPCKYIGFEGSETINILDIEGAALFPGLITLINFLITYFDTGDGTYIGVVQDGVPIYSRNSSTGVDVPLLAVPGTYDTAGAQSSSVSVYRDHPTGEVKLKCMGIFL